MSEYIEREKAIMYAHNALPFNPNECEKLEEVLRMMPAADVAPVVHGKWETGHYDEFGNYVWPCSNCKRESEEFSPYCPNCGAKMDVEE